MENKIIVAIDGPSGTGKSVTAKLLAKKLSLPYIDSGAYYRAITYLIIKDKIKPNEIKKIEELSDKCNLTFDNDSVFLNGEDVTTEIRSIDVTNKVSSVSKIKQVRAIVNEKLRNFAKENGLVMDGRDIGTVVFPNADFKFYLTCDMKVRAQRRKQDFLDNGQRIPLNKVLVELQKRDEVDTRREEAPLKKHKDAIEVDTTNLIIEEQVDFIYKKIIGSENEF
jgi:cytidylate kinase